MAFGGLLILLLPALSYTIFMKSKRFFIPLWTAYIVLAGLLLLVSIYYLAGSNEYRDYLSQVSAVVDSTPNYCEASMCNKATCARMTSFHSSRCMVEAFCIIGTIGSLYIAGAGFMINLTRRKSNEI